MMIQSNFLERYWSPYVHFLIMRNIEEGFGLERRAPCPERKWTRPPQRPGLEH